MFDIFGNFKGWLCGDLKFLPSDSVARRSRLTALLFVRESAVLVVSMGAAATGRSILRVRCLAYFYISTLTAFLCLYNYVLLMAAHLDLIQLIVSEAFCTLRRMSGPYADKILNVFKIV